VAWPGHPTRSSVPAPIGLRAASSVTVGEQHSCAVLKSGVVECWGANGLGQLGDESTRNRPTPRPVHGTSQRAVMVSAGFEHTCALLRSGEVECWGANRFGQLGDGRSNDREAPVRVHGLHGAAIAISAGGRHTCAVLARGQVECWGANYSGQLGNGRVQDHAGPVRVRGVSRAVGVSAGRAYTCAVERAGAVKCWGANAFGQLGNGTVTARRLPTRVRGLRGRAVAVSAAQRHTCALLRGGGVACWGANGTGQLGDGSTVNSYVAVAARGLHTATSVTTGISHTCALTSAGGIRCWGMNASGELGAGTLFRSSSPLRVTRLAGAVGISAGGGHTCARTGAGAVSCWGANYARQLGNQSRLDSSTPVSVFGLSSPAASIAAGDRHTCVVTKVAEVACWGANDGGQLGDGSRRDRGRAQTVRALAGHTVRVTAGESHTCALSSERNVQCWGENGSGQLGNGTFVRHRTPSAVVDLAEVTDVSAGGRHTCAVATAGVVECWGANDWGQLGTRLRQARSRPLRVKGLAGVATVVATGDNHTCALTEAGVVECWGANDLGQLGSSATQTARAEPALVPGLAGKAIAVTSGANHTCALTSSGGVRCWGANDSGQLGDGTFRAHRRPVAVRGLRNAIAVSAGGDHTCALTKAGALLCWGWDYWGQLGDGAPPASGSPSPVHVVGL
jgi:alpha-tubulin suppressor-like RCC1 family protein